MVRYLSCFRAKFKSLTLYNDEVILVAKAKFIGVYASVRPSSVQSAAVPGKSSLWFAWEDGWGRYRVQLLDNTLQPAESPKIVTSSEFKATFLHQPKILATPISQADVVPVEDISKGVTLDLEAEADLYADFLPGGKPKAADARKDAQKSAQKDAEDEEKAALVDRKVRSEFAIALAKWKDGDKVAPLKVFENICNLEEGLVPAHKHMFTTFAIDLRKSNLPTMALRHYQKAVELSPEDSNAHFNLARIYYEVGRLDDAVAQLEQSLELAPEFKMAESFLEFIAKQQAKYSPNKGFKAGTPKRNSRDSIVFNFK